MDDSFPIRPEELTLRFRHPPGQRKLSHANFHGTREEWREACRAKLVELLALEKPPPCAVATQRKGTIEDIEIEALIMTVDEQLSIPAYLLTPPAIEKSAVVALHGHGEARSAIGLGDDYHRRYALELAKAGHLVLCPELRGFGALTDLALQEQGHRLDYSSADRHRTYALCSDSFQHGQPLIGQTIEDLMRWEDWLAREYEEHQLDAVGLSYGGDLALTYSVFSARVRKVFASSTFGSFTAIFARCNSAPAYCIPGVLEWMDRADIAGLNAPRPLALHYGQLDARSPQNDSASHNETVEAAVGELRTIYKAFNAEDAVRQIVTPNIGHEMDNAALVSFLAD